LKFGFLSFLLNISCEIPSKNDQNMSNFVFSTYFGGKKKNSSALQCPVSQHALMEREKSQGKYEGDEKRK